MTVTKFDVDHVAYVYYDDVKQYLPENNPIILDFPLGPGHHWY